MRDLCPDCQATSKLIELEPHVYRWVIQHDDTCPVLAAIEREKTQ